LFRRLQHATDDKILPRTGTSHLIEPGDKHGVPYRHLNCGISSSVEEALLCGLPGCNHAKLLETVYSIDILPLTVLSASNGGSIRFYRDWW
jgi:hypothetical protein